MMPAHGVRRVLLVGFMGSGKTTVGAILAESLGWPLVDFDAVIEAREGRSIAAIFEEGGEPHFREIERAVAAELLARDRVVLAAGGGWAAVPGRLRDVPDGTVSVWLKVSVDTAVDRAANQPGARPLLAGPGGKQAIGALLAKREAAYAEADVEVDTDGRTPDDVSARVLSAMGPTMDQRRRESAVEE